MEENIDVDQGADQRIGAAISLGQPGFDPPPKKNGSQVREG